MEVVRRALLLGRQSCACAVVQLCGIGIFVRVWMQTDRLVTAYMNLIFYWLRTLSTRSNGSSIDVQQLMPQSHEQRHKTSSVQRVERGIRPPGESRSHRLAKDWRWRRRHQAPVMCSSLSFSLMCSSSETTL